MRTSIIIGDPTSEAAISMIEIARLDGQILLVMEEKDIPADNKYEICPLNLTDLVKYAPKRSRAERRAFERSLKQAKKRWNL